MADYLIPDDLRAYVTDTDLRKYAPLSTTVDPIEVKYLESWNLVVDDAEIYLDTIVNRKGLEALIAMTDVTKPVRRFLGYYLQHKLALDRVGNNPQQIISDIEFDLYKAKIDNLVTQWKDAEFDLTDVDLGAEANPERPTSNDVIQLFRR